MTLQTYTGEKLFNQIVKIEQDLTLQKSIDTGSVLINSGDKVQVIRRIIKIIEYFLEATGKELEKLQIKILAGDLYDIFKTDTIEDIILMFKMARKGEFGKLYKFDTMTISDWAQTYLEKKSEERENLYHERKVTKISSNEKDGYLTPERLQELRKLKEIEDLKCKERIKKIEKPPRVNDLEGFMDRLKNRHKYRDLK